MRICSCPKDASQTGDVTSHLSSDFWTCDSFGPATERSREVRCVRALCLIKRLEVFLGRWSDDAPCTSFCELLFSAGSLSRPSLVEAIRTLNVPTLHRIQNRSVKIIGSCKPAKLQT
jgi:hypothetical protein